MIYSQNPTEYAILMQCLLMYLKKIYVERQIYFLCDTGLWVFVVLCSRNKFWSFDWTHVTVNIIFLRFGRRDGNNTKEVFEDIYNSWLYCFTNPLELGTHVSLSQRNTCPKFKRISETI